MGLWGAQGQGGCGFRSGGEKGVLPVPNSHGGGRLEEVGQQRNSRQAPQLELFPSNRPWGVAQLCQDQIGLKRGEEGATPVGTAVDCVSQHPC